MWLRMLSLQKFLRFIHSVRIEPVEMPVTKPQL
jgi:hypothetical protein